MNQISLFLTVFLVGLLGSLNWNAGSASSAEVTPASVHGGLADLDDFVRVPSSETGDNGADPDCDCNVGANVLWNGDDCERAAVLKLWNDSQHGTCKSDCSGVTTHCNNRYIVKVLVGGFDSVHLSQNGNPVRCDPAPGLVHNCTVNVCGGMSSYVIQLFNGPECTGELLCSGFLWCACNGCTAPIG
jgi:hypothetical protein